MTTSKNALLNAGDRFGDFLILRHISTGGMAEVYLARKTGYGGFIKHVALKIILPFWNRDKRFIQMFQEEARLAVCLEHPHITQVIDLGEVGGRSFIAMEFAHGKDLSQISRKIHHSGRLIGLQYPVKIVSQVAEGLHTVHTKRDDQGNPLRIVHSDISPQNIMVTFHGVTKLIDFGIAKSARQVRLTENLLTGKLSYMSPEQLRSEPLDGRSDIFSLGIVLWEACTNTTLFQQGTEALIAEALLDLPIPRPSTLRGDIPKELERITMKALARDLDARYQTAQDLHLDLQRVASAKGWKIGQQELGDLVKGLFPDDFTEIHELIQEDARNSDEEMEPVKEFVPWEPYVQDAVTPLPQAIPLAGPDGQRRFSESPTMDNEEAVDPSSASDEIPVIPLEAGEPETGSGSRWVWALVLFALGGVSFAVSVWFFS